MSASSSHALPDPHAHGHGHAGHGGGAHATRKDYVLGFVLAAVLTAPPFWLVMSHAASPQVTVLCVMAMAAVQVVVHMIYFLHMNSRSEGGWNLIAMLFTVLFVAIVLSGSIWVMYHLNVNMMPMTPQEMRQMP